MKNIPQSHDISAGRRDPGVFTRADFLISLVLVLLCLAVYNANWRIIAAGDTRPARFLPFSILRYHTLYMEKIESAASCESSRPYWIIPGRGGRHVSLYPIVTPLFVTPLYIPAVLWLDAHGWTDHRLDRVARLMEKISASVVASLSAGIMYLVLRRRVNLRVALLLAAAYAFGTNTWTISSQALWQHGVAELLLGVMLLLVTSRSTAPRAAALGALGVLVTFNRPPDVFFAAAIGVYGLMWAGRRMPFIVAGAAIPCGLLLAYNLGMVGHILGGQGLVIGAPFFGFNMSAGVAGLLFSPARGLFVFTPFLLALIPGFRRAFPQQPTGPAGKISFFAGERALCVLLCFAFAIQVLVYAKTDWRAGAAWGPRFLTDAIPFLVWMLAPVVASMSSIGLGAFICAVCISIAIQAVGAFWYTGWSDQRLDILSTSPAAMKAVWDIHKAPIVVELSHPRAPRDLTIKVEGEIERITAAGQETTEAATGSEIVVSGWTLTGHRTPWRVIAQVVPSAEVRGWHYAMPHPLQDTLVFHLRSDVNVVRNRSYPIGWSIPLKLTDLNPGNYVVEIVTQASDSAEFYSVGRHPFKVLPKLR